MRVSIDTARCQGHGRCVLLAPDVFDFNDDGFGFVAIDVVPGEFEGDVRAAVVGCPESAITIQ